MGKLALSLDTVRLKWGIVAPPTPKTTQVKELGSSAKALTSATKNQLKKRRPKKRRR